MRSISLKLLVSFVAVSVTGVILFFTIASRYSNQEIENFLFNQDLSQVTDGFAQYYAENGSWEGIQTEWPRMGTGGGVEGRFPSYILVDANQVVLKGRENDPSGYKSGDILSESELENAFEISVNDQAVGWLLLMPQGGPKGYFPESPIYDRINRLLLYSAGGSLVLALVLGMVLSRTLSRPLKQLSEAAQQAATGDLDQKVEVSSRDEIGLLANSFNKMMADLKRLMASRRQMTADIAHDLRTPISVILGHADGVHEGVLDPTPERFEIIRDEALRLERLVQDLRVLSMADVGKLPLNYERVDPWWIVHELARTSTTSLDEKSIRLVTETPQDLPDIEVDKDRVLQVFRNILENAIRFTPENGEIALSCALDAAGQLITFRVLDGGPGVAEVEIGKIFDRFYRTDPSRQRDQMGSGLGLAIARSITEQHGGKIWAEPGESSGLAIIVQLPVANA